MSIAQIQGINVPNDLSVVGFDDTTLATVVWPNITTVRQPIDEMATLAVSLFTSNKNKDFSGLKNSQLRHILEFEIIKRESSKSIV